MQSASLFQASQHDSLDIKVNDSEVDNLLFIKPEDSAYPKNGNFYSNSKCKQDKRRAAYASTDNRKGSKTITSKTDRHRLSYNTILPSIRDAKRLEGSRMNIENHATPGYESSMMIRPQVKITSGESEVYQRTRDDVEKLRVAMARENKIPMLRKDVDKPAIPNRLAMV